MTHRLKTTVLDLVKVYDSLNSDLCKLNLGYVVWSWAQLRFITLAALHWDRMLSLPERIRVPLLAPAACNVWK